MSKLSIITLTFNSGAYIQRCLSSVRQVLKDIDFEHIIIDGNSTDGTLEYINTYANSYENVTIHNQTPSGIYSALNLGIKSCTRDYVLFLHSDDILLEEFKSFLEKKLTSDIYFCGVEIMYKNKFYRKYKPYYFASKYMNAIYPPPHTGMVIRLECLKKYQFDVKYKIASDYMQLLELLQKSELTKTYVQAFIVSMASGGKSTKLTNSIKIFEEELKILHEQRISFKILILIVKKLCKVFTFRYGKA